MSDIIDMNVPDTAERANGAASVDRELEAVLDVAREMRKTENVRVASVQRADQAMKALIQLGGEVRGILRMAGGPDTLEDAIKANWRGLQQRLREEMN